MKTVARPAQVFLVRAQDMDNIINVEVASEFPGGLGYSYFPSAFVLEIGYKQVRDAASVDGVAASRACGAIRSESVH